LTESILAFLEEEEEEEEVEEGLLAHLT